MRTDDVSTWDDARRIADELRVQIHLASMNARDRWHELEPRVETLEKSIVHSGEHLSETLVRELHDVREALRALRDDVYARTRGDYVQGW